MTFNQSDHRFDLLSHLSGHLVVAVLNLRLSFCVRVLNMAVYALVVLLMMIKKVTWDCKLFQRAPSLLPIGEFRYRRNGWPLAVWRQPMVNVLSAHPCCWWLRLLVGEVHSGNSKEGRHRVPTKTSVRTYMLLQVFFERMRGLIWRLALICYHAVMLVSVAFDKLLSFASVH